MIEGKYNIKMKTPIGDQKGAVTFEIKDNKLIGVLEIMGSSNSFEGTVDGNSFTFGGETTSPIGKVRIHFRRQCRR